MVSYLRTILYHLFPFLCQDIKLLSKIWISCIIHQREKPGDYEFSFFDHCIYGLKLINWHSVPFTSLLWSWLYKIQSVSSILRVLDKINFLSCQYWWTNLKLKYQDGLPIRKEFYQALFHFNKDNYYQAQLYHFQV